MAGKRSKKSRGGKKDTPKRREFPGGGGQAPTQTREPSAQDPKRRLGQFGRAGEPPLIKR
jgi:hypothetical protein